MTLRGKVGLVPHCDRVHGQMSFVNLQADARDYRPAAKCQEPGCNRIYTQTLGYRDLDEHGQSNHNPKDPRCKEHEVWMCVSETLPEHTLKYVCPVDRCSGTETVKGRD